MNKKPDPLQYQFGSHCYAWMAYQTAEYAERSRLTYLEGCCLKFLAVYERRNGIRDLCSAIHCLDTMESLGTIPTRLRTINRLSFRSELKRYLTMNDFSEFQQVASESAILMPFAKTRQIILDRIADITEQQLAEEEYKMFDEDGMFTLDPEYYTHNK